MGVREIVNLFRGMEPADAAEFDVEDAAGVQGDGLFGQKCAPREDGLWRSCAKGCSIIIKLNSSKRFKCAVSARV